MPLRSLVEGESRLFAYLGANVTLGGAHAALTQGLERLMPLVSHLLTLVQLAVGVATLIYMLFKIRKVWRHRQE